MKKHFTLIGIAKNEGPYILEWVAHHLLVGFDDIIIFQNDSDDFTHQTLACLRNIGVINYKYNKAKVGAHQVTAYIRAARQPEYKKADWIMALDIDEFLNIKTGNGTLPDLLKATPDVHKILVNWLLFGNAGQKTLTDELVIERFTKTEDPASVKKVMCAYKALFRRDAFTRAGIHKPNKPLLDDALIKTANGSGMPDDEFHTKNFRCSDPKGRHLVQINHYIVRDAQSFIIKSDRGSAHQTHRPIHKEYWAGRNKNDSIDKSLATTCDKVWEKMAALDELSKGRLFKFRKLAIENHHAKLAALLREDDPRELYDFCCV